MQGFLVQSSQPTHCWNSSLASQFPLNILAFQMPLHLETSVNLSWSEYGYFLEPHNESLLHMKKRCYIHKNVKELKEKVTVKQHVLLATTGQIRKIVVVFILQPHQQKRISTILFHTN